MSEWYDIKKEDIFLNPIDEDDKSEININFGHNNMGARYITLQTKDIVEFIKENKLI